MGERRYYDLPSLVEQLSDQDKRPRGLAATYAGYMHQDLVTAYFVAEAVAENRSVVVDKKVLGAIYLTT